MELPPSLMYLCFFASLSVFALIPLRVLLTKVDELSNHSSHLQQILHTFVCFSFSYAFLFNPSLRLPRTGSALLPPLWCFPYLAEMICLCLAIPHNFSDLVLNYALFMVVIQALLVAAGELNKDLDYIPASFYHLAWVIFTGFTTIVYHKDQIIQIEFNNPFYPYVVGLTAGYFLYCRQSTSESRISIQVPLRVKIVIGIVGNILANHYLKDKGFPLFWLLVCLAVFLMGNIVMMEATCHTAIFGFLVGVVVDVAGDIFGLGIGMWLVGGGCAALLVFFERLDKFNGRNHGGHTREEKVEEDTTLMV